jgi:hypothetical protein
MFGIVWLDIGSLLIIPVVIICQIFSLAWWEGFIIWYALTFGFSFGRMYFFSDLRKEKQG